MENKELPKDSQELDSLSIGKKMQTATAIGEVVGKIMESANKRANKFLKKYGYSVSVTLNFHELKKDD